MTGNSVLDQGINDDDDGDLLTKRSDQVKTTTTTIRSNIQQHGDAAKVEKGGRPPEAGEEGSLEEEAMLGSAPASKFTGSFSDRFLFSPTHTSTTSTSTSTSGKSGAGGLSRSEMESWNKDDNESESAPLVHLVLSLF